MLEWLAALDKENRFHLIACSHELVGGEFTRAVNGEKKLSKVIVEVCPSVLDEGPETADELSAELKKRKSFLLRWD